MIHKRNEARDAQKGQFGGREVNLLKRESRKSDELRLFPFYKFGRMR